jgi:hypothetical protein
VGSAHLRFLRIARPGFHAWVSQFLRQSVHHIEVCGPGPTYQDLIWPEAIVSLFYNGRESP